MHNLSFYHKEANVAWIKFETDLNNSVKKQPVWVHDATFKMAEFLLSLACCNKWLEKYDTYAYLICYINVKILSLFYYYYSLYFNRSFSPYDINNDCCSPTTIVC